MNNGPVVLLNWVEETIHPQQITISPLTETDLQTLRKEFTTVVKTFRKKVFEQLIFSEKQTASVMKQLVKISDTVHHYLWRLAPCWKRSLSAPQIKSFYLFALNFLEAVLEELGRLAPEILMQIPVTQYSQPNLIVELKGRYKFFELHLDQLDIDDDLKNLVKKGLNQLIQKREINLMNVEYSRNLMTAVTAKEKLDTATFRRLLFLYGFNLPEFFLYCISSYKDVMENTPGLHEQLEMLMTEQDKLDSLLVNCKIQMLTDVASINKQLRGFLSEKKQYVKQMLKLRRAMLKDDQLAKSMIRLKINMSVAQFGLFIRVQIEKGLLLKENIGELFNFFAAHFYTHQTMFISAESLRKKSTDVEFSTAQKLKAHLIAMLNWLNENYNLSNYKGS